MEFKKEPQMKVVSIRLPVELVELAKTNNINLSKIARFYLAKELKKYSK